MTKSVWQQGFELTGVFALGLLFVSIGRGDITSISLSAGLSALILMTVIRVSDGESNKLGWFFPFIATFLTFIVMFVILMLAMRFASWIEATHTVLSLLRWTGYTLISFVTVFLACMIVRDFWFGSRRTAAS